MKIAHLKYDIAVGIQTFFVAFVFIILFSSCQKEVTGDLGTPNTTPATPATPATNSAKVKTYTEDATFTNGPHLTETFNLTYDNNDRLLSMISTTTPGNKFIYQYNADNTYTMDIYMSNVLSIHELFFLNNLPLVDSTIQYDAYSKDTMTEKYTYNSSKQLVTLKQYNYSKTSGSTLLAITNSEYDNSGNVIKETSGSSTTTYDYYPDFINNLYVGLIYYPQSKNFVKTTTQTEATSKAVINHTYTFDSSNRITSEKEVYSSGDIVIKTYTY